MDIVALYVRITYIWYLYTIGERIMLSYVRGSYGKKRIIIIRRITYNDLIPFSSYVTIRYHTFIIRSSYVSIRYHTLPYVTIRYHTFIIRYHMLSCVHLTLPYVHYTLSYVHLTLPYVHYTFIIRFHMFIIRSSYVTICSSCVHRRGFICSCGVGVLEYRWNCSGALLME